MSETLKRDSLLALQSQQKLFELSSGTRECCAFSLDSVIPLAIFADILSDNLNRTKQLWVQENLSILSNIYKTMLHKNVVFVSFLKLNITI